MCIRDSTPEALEILKNKRKGTYNVIKIDPAYRPAPIELSLIHIYYTIRAGRNLPDKEFRYLRTVIGTAAGYRGLSSHLRVPS